MTLPHVSFPMYPISLVTAGRWGYVLCDVLCACCRGDGWHGKSPEFGGWVAGFLSVVLLTLSILFQPCNVIFIENLDAKIELYGNERWFSVWLWHTRYLLLKTVVRNSMGLDHTWVMDGGNIWLLHCFQAQSSCTYMPLYLGVPQGSMLLPRVPYFYPGFNVCNKGSTLVPMVHTRKILLNSRTILKNSKYQHV